MSYLGSYNFESIRRTFDRASVFHDAIIFYPQNDKSLSQKKYYSSFLKGINNSNVDARIACFYKIVSSGSSKFPFKNGAFHEDTGSIKDRDILAAYPFLKCPVDQDILQELIKKLSKYNFLSKRQADRFSKKIDTPLELPQLLTLFMREAFRQASRACIEVKETTLAEDLEAAVRLHFNNKDLFKELNGLGWIERIHAARDDEDALNSLDEEMYKLLADTPERDPVQRVKKNTKKKEKRPR